jgi:hypothetical protein
MDRQAKDPAAGELIRYVYLLINYENNLQNMVQIYYRPFDDIDGFHHFRMYISKNMSR